VGRRAKGTVKHQGGKSIAILRGEYLGSHENDALAQEAIDAALEMDAGKLANTLAVHGVAWMDAREEDGDTRGIDEEWSVWRNHIATAPFYGKVAPKILPSEITKHLKQLTKKRVVHVLRKKSGLERRELDRTLSWEVINRVRRLLRQAFQSMVDDGLLAVNPVLASKMPKMEGHAEEEDEEWTFLFAEEITALFDFIESIVPTEPAILARLKPRTLERLEQRRCFYRAVYALAVYGGLRQGEIFGLHWEDIHFEARGLGDRSNSLKVRRTRNMGRAPKSESSKRWVPLLPPLRAALEAWRKHGGVLKAIGKVFPADGAAGQGNKPKALGGYFGTSYDAAWEVRFRRIACGRERDYVTFHDLRHTCASHLIMGSWGLPLTPFEVMEWLGHADLKTTKRYMHLAPGALEELVRKMGQGVSKAEAARRAELTRRMMQYGKR
jgi:integrase